MKRFAYWRDSLCITCCGLYTANRCVVRPHLHLRFFHSWFNDLLLIPCALPLLLFIHRKLGLRIHDEAPTAGEILAHLIGWSILFEVIGPYIVKHTTGDVWDVVAYSTGALFAFAWWRREPLLARLQR